MKLNLSEDRGFTLIELLVVIAIIGVLSVSIITALNSARQSARDTKRREHMRNLVSAMELYINDNPIIPDESESALENALVTDGEVLKELPYDPVDSGEFVYKYYRQNDMSYKLCAKLERGGETVIGEDGNVNDSDVEDCPVGGAVISQN